jgi:hypothetical protein
VTLSAYITHITVGWTEDLNSDWLGRYTVHWTPVKDVQVTKSKTSNREISLFFLLLWVIFAPLDQYPDSDYGSGSTELIESGSNRDPDQDPQPCF